MEKQTVINAISAFTAALDAMKRAENEVGIEKVADKILELIKQL